MNNSMFVFISSGLKIKEKVVVQNNSITVSTFSSTKAIIWKRSISLKTVKLLRKIPLVSLYY